MKPLPGQRGIPEQGTNPRLAGAMQLCLTTLGFIHPTLLGWHATDSGREALAGNL